MLFIYFGITIGIIILMYFVIPKGTNFHEILRIPYYNYKAQTVRRDDMTLEKFYFGKHSRQHLLFCASLDKNQVPKKIILYFHGGGWTFGNPMIFRCSAQIYIDQGYAVSMATYRRLPFFRAKDMKEDATLALQKTLEILNEKGWQDKPIILSGLSSGGHLAALLSFDQSKWSAIGFSRKQLAGIMLFGTPLDLTKMAWTPVTWWLAGNKNSTYFKEVNPVNYISLENKDIPMLLLHGTKDGLVNYKSSLSFIKKRGDRNLTFYSIKRGTHMDSGLWIFEDGKEKRLVLDWLENT